MITKVTTRYEFEVHFESQTKPISLGDDDLHRGLIYWYTGDELASDEARLLLTSAEEKLSSLRKKKKLPKTEFPVEFRIDKQGDELFAIFSSRAIKRA